MTLGSQEVDQTHQTKQHQQAATHKPLLPSSPSNCQKVNLVPIFEDKNGVFTQPHIAEEIYSFSVSLFHSFFMSKTFSLLNSASHTKQILCKTAFPFSICVGVCGVNPTDCKFLSLFAMARSLKNLDICGIAGVSVFLFLPSPSVSEYYVKQITLNVCFHNPLEFLLQFSSIKLNMLFPGTFCFSFIEFNNVLTFPYIVKHILFNQWLKLPEELEPELCFSLNT